MKLVWIQSPRAGLGNKILVWANGVAYAKRYNLNYVTTGWVSIFVGPILRGETSLRFYSGYFKECSLWQKLKVKILGSFYTKFKNPKEFEFDETNKLVVFNEVKFWMHFFDDIRDYRSYIKTTFYKELLKKSLYKSIQHLSAPLIGIHIRMGDFSNQKVEKNFNWDKSTLERTPLSYFSTVISELRALAKKQIKVTLFSDGTREELREILAIPDVSLASNQRDIDDLIQLSKSKVIVCSASSTFSLLAGYFSEAALIHHPNFYIRPIRDEEFNDNHFEGPFKTIKEMDYNMKKLLLEKLN